VAGTVKFLSKRIINIVRKLYCFIICIFIILLLRDELKQCTKHIFFTSEL
jgi:hypothetical protein